MGRITKRWLTILLLLGLALGVTVRVWAEFTGPDRSIRNQVRNPSADRWVCTRNSPPATCTFQNPNNPCPDFGGFPPSVGSQLAACGWIADNCGCNAAYTTVTVNQPPATVSGAFVCTTPGNAGWCQGGANLNLSAQEPLSGQVITVIEGSVGNGILCDPANAANVSCVWPASTDGEFNVNFWAVSSYGDTSAMGNAAINLDSVAPSLSLTTSGGQPGENGWYRSGPVALSPTASDSTSGLSSAEVSLNGGAWQGELSINSDGEHSIQGRAFDNAGNSNQASTTIRIDSTGPNVQAGISGPQGSASWFTGAVSVNANASDSLSGLAGTSIQINGGDWRAAPQTISQDGQYTVRAMAIDQAGNSSQSADQTVRIDTREPSIQYDLDGEAGQEGWFISEVLVRFSANDATSGINRIESRLDSGGWQAGNTVQVGVGETTVAYRAIDIAGHSAEAVVVVRVDLQGPTTTIDPSSQGVIAQSVEDFELRGTVQDDLSGVAQVQVSIDGGDSWSSVLEEAGVWVYSVPAGIQSDASLTFLARARDVAGNVGEEVSFEWTADRSEDEPEVEPLAPVDGPPLPVTGPGESADPDPGANLATTAIAPLDGSEVLDEQSVQIPDLPRHVWIWPFLGWLGLMIGIGWSKIVDRRPRELDQLRSDLNRIRKVRH